MDSLEILLGTRGAELSQEEWFKLIDIRYQRVRSVLKELPAQMIGDIKCLFKDGHPVPYGHSGALAGTQEALALHSPCWWFNDRIKVSDPNNTLNGKATVVILTNDSTTGWAIMKFQIVCMGSIPDTEEVAMDVTLCAATTEEMLSKHEVQPEYLFTQLSKLYAKVAEARDKASQESAKHLTRMRIEDEVCKKLKVPQLIN